MPEIDDYSDVLSPQMRAAWPVVASATARLKGSLVGGTALTLTLRHRESFDLDFLVREEFSGTHLFRRLRELTDLPCDLERTETDTMYARVGGVVVQVFRQPWRGANPGFLRVLRRPTIIDGMRVASMADLLATKLDVILYRPKLRDYIDIAAIDKDGPYRIEDGLRFHTERYGVPSHSSVPEQIVQLLENPGRLDEDLVFADEQQDTLEYLRSRAHQARAALGSWRAAPPTHKLSDEETLDYLSASRPRGRRQGRPPA